MQHRQRIYDTILQRHFTENRQMAWVVGARQVGKTSSCRVFGESYLNWDNFDDRQIFIQGPLALAQKIGLFTLHENIPTAVFDELHKWAQWQSLLKGFFDTYGDQVRLLVTGSSHLDVYRRGGDSLMGRYFLYRMYPFSVAETLTVEYPDPERIVRQPAEIADDEFSALYEHGGFPEPFLLRSDSFTRRWRTLRNHQLLREDIRETTRIQELGQIEVLAKILAAHSGGQINFSGLATEVRASGETVRRWVETLIGLHYGFIVRPWHKNIANALRKEPKWFQQDWSMVTDTGARIETMVACHLKKAVDGWSDMGLGLFDLWYVRDKQKREVDFLVTRDEMPWFLVEVKTSDCSLSPSLFYYQEKTEAPFAFQAVFDLPFVNADCFAHPGKPIVIPIRTFLSQLL